MRADCRLHVDFSARGGLKAGAVASIELPGGEKRLAPALPKRCARRLRQRWRVAPTREQLAQIKWEMIEAEKEEKAAADALRMAQQELEAARAEEDKAKEADEKRKDLKA